MLPASTEGRARRRRPRAASSRRSWGETNASTGSVPVGLRRQPTTVGAERRRPHGDRLTDRAEADDQPRRPRDLAELVPIPRAAALRVAPSLGLLEVVEHRPQHVLADRDVGDVRVGEPHAPLEHGGEHGAVEARVRDAEPPQRRRSASPSRRTAATRPRTRRRGRTPLPPPRCPTRPSASEPSFCIATGSYSAGSRASIRSSVPWVSEELQMRPSSCTASRSSASSATDASMRPREKSSMSRPCTTDHSPLLHVAGKDEMRPSATP